MDKSVLIQYVDAGARLKRLYEKRAEKQKKLDEINDTSYYVTDVVTCGKKGKKPLRTLIIAGQPYPERDEIREELEKQDDNLRAEEIGLLKLQTIAEEYISGIDDIEMRNLMEFSIIEGMNWIKVAHVMNELHPKRRPPYTSDSCRMAVNRYFGKY